MQEGLSREGVNHSFLREPLHLDPVKTMGDPSADLVAHVSNQCLMHEVY